MVPHRHRCSSVLIEGGAPYRVRGMACPLLRATLSTGRLWYRTVPATRKEHVMYIGGGLLLLILIILLLVLVF
jgi:hypothetical protein